MSRHIILVDETVENSAQIIAQAQGQYPGAEIVYLLNDISGVEQISQALSGQTDIGALHVISHGGPGYLSLGSDILSGEALGYFAPEIEGWKDALAEGADILFYGCNVAGSPDGIDLINTLSTMTGADVAASDNLTGAASLGGDWVLEQAVGQITTDAIVAESYDGLMATVPAVPAMDNTYTVTNLNDSGAGSLRQAILDANASYGTDAIYFDTTLTGSISLGSELLIDADSGTFNTFVIDATGATGGVTLDGGNTNRILNIQNEFVSIFGGGNLTMQNGNAGASYGGLISAQNVNGTSGRRLFIDETELSNGTAIRGGAIDFGGSELTITNSTISGSDASGTYGGGIFIYDTGTYLLNDISISDTTITGNTANKVGGGIDMEQGRLTVDGGEISFNQVTGSGGTAYNYYGGGVFVGYEAKATLQGGLTIANNDGGNKGGGLSTGSVSMAGSMAPDYGVGATINLNDVTFSQNTATYGAAAYIGYSADASMESVTFDQNGVAGTPKDQSVLHLGHYYNSDLGTDSTVWDGGFLRLAAADTLTFTGNRGSSTFIMNQFELITGGSAGGTLSAPDTTPLGVHLNALNVAHTINGSSGDDTVYGSSTTSSGGDVISTGTGNDLVDVGSGDHTITGTSAELNNETIRNFSDGDTLLITGSDETALDGALLTTNGSVSLSGGTNVITFSNAYGGETGQISVNYSGGNSTLTIAGIPPTGDLAIQVTNLNDSGAGSLRQAIFDVGDGGEITFSNDLNGDTLTLASGLVLDQAKSFDITGFADQGFTIDGGGNYRIFNINDGDNATDQTVGISGLTLNNGRHYDSSAIYSQETLSLTNSTIQNGNSSQGTSVYLGGDAAGSSIEGVAFVNNTGYRGGGLNVQQDNVLVSGSYFDGNDGYYGGALYAYGSGLTVEGSLFKDNSVSSYSYTPPVPGAPTYGPYGGHGGAIYSLGSGFTVNNSTFYNNSADYDGGAIYGTGTINSSTFVGNSASRGASDIHSGSGTSSIYNSILTGSYGGGVTIGGDYNLFTSIADTSGSSISGNTNSVFTNASGAALGTLADNGGNLQTIALNSGSLAIDAGDATAVPGGITTDMRGAGFDRVVDVDAGGVDIGAFEAQTAPAVAPTPTPVTTTPSPSPAPDPTFELEDVFTPEVPDDELFFDPTDDGTFDPNGDGTGGTGDDFEDDFIFQNNGDDFAGGTLPGDSGVGLVMSSGLGINGGLSGTANATDDILALLIPKVDEKAGDEASRQDMTGAAQDFLNGLGNGQSVEVQTLTLNDGGNGDGSAEVIRLNGGDSTGGTDEAFILDTTGLQDGVQIVLNDIGFAAIIGEATISGGEGANFLSGDGAGQSISSGEGNDTVMAGGGDDTMDGGAGDDLLNGGDGIDALSISGNFRSYNVGRVSQDSEGQDTVSVSGSDIGTDTLIEVEQIEFNDGTLFFEGLTPEQIQVSRMYLTAFARDGDTGGVNFWQGTVENGASVNDIAEGFVDADAIPEFGNMYGDDVSNVDFLVQLYQTGLGREADASGLAFWLELMEGGGFSQGDVLLAIANSNEQINRLEAIYGDGVFLV